jgi:glycosyltransferase involved in cell wall biosynthesis
VEVVGRGVDTSLFSFCKRDNFLRNSWGLTENDTAVLYVGRLAPEKNIQLVLDAFQRMRSKDPGLRLVLVGDGPSRKSLEHKYPQVIFTGMQRGEALARHYASGDIFIFPSITETFGNVILEAMASGLAIVAFDYAAAREYLRHNESALLASYDNQPEFVKLAYALAGCRDTIESLRRSAQEIAKTCTWNNTISQLEHVYFSLLSSEGERKCCCIS